MTLLGARGWLTVAVLLVGACGSSGGGGAGGSGGGGARGGAGGGSGSAGTSGGGGIGGSDLAAAFVGNWTFNAGSIAPTCTGVNIAAIPLTGDTATIRQIDASHIALAFSNAQLNCNLNFAVSGSTATAAAGQTCLITEMGTSAPVNVTSWTLMLSGNTLSMTMAGTAQIAIISCTPSGTGTLARS